MINHDIKRGIEIILPEDSLEKKLSEGRALNIKLGFDPTAPDLHLGHLVVLKKIREFQDAGHNIFLIVGDFTAQIGDPTGKNVTRPALSKGDIKANEKTYINQLGKVLNTRKVILKKNSSWFKRMKLEDTLHLLSFYNLGRLLTRDDFQKRMKSDSAIAVHEIMYPLLQGYDSVMIHSDIEIGGTDQLFNMQVGRHLQESALPEAQGQKAQTVICMPLLRGLDGEKKMSKSLGNYIGLTDTPNDMFGKIMSIPDTLIEEYINLVTDFSDEEKTSLISESKDNPMDVKKKIGVNIVTQLHSTRDAENAEEYFKTQFQNKDAATKEYKEVGAESLNLTDESIIIDLLIGLGVRDSKSKARELIMSGGVRVNDEKIEDPTTKVSDLQESGEILLKAGKLNFFKITF